VSTIAAAMLGYAVLMAFIATAYAAFPFASAPPGQVAIVLGWSTALMVYDTTMASKNGLGQSGAYAALALYRNLVATLLSVGLVLLGYGAVGAMLGQIAGTLIPTLLSRSSIRIWKETRLAQASRSLMLGMVKFGVGGSLALGLYMLFNATSRNMVGLFLGEAQAGYISLATDLFFGPLALLGTAYSLSIIPSLYVAEAEGNAERQRAAISKYLHMNFYLAIPYAIGGAILAPDIAAAILPGANRTEIASVAAGAAVQSAAMLVLGTITAILLIFNRRPLLIPAVLGTSALNGLLLAGILSRGYSLPSAAWASAVILGGAVACLIGLGVALKLMRLELGTLVRSGTAAGAMGGAVWAYNRILLPGEPFGAVLIGAVIYLGLTALMGVAHVKELTPKRRRDQIGSASIPIAIE
jgi:O-antigen/teichoic acid export membrane protein